MLIHKMKVRMEPIAALPLVEHHLRESQPDAQKAESDVVDLPRAAGLFRRVRRIGDQPTR